MSDHRVRVATYAVCVRGTRLLLVHQVCRGPAQFQWTLPGGGLEFGESPTDGLRRELLEETGASVAVGEVLAVHDGVYEWEAHQRHAVRLLYRADLDGEPAVVAPDEVDQVGWFDVTDLPEPCTAWARLAAGLVVG